jgi:hypothetical protein
MDLPETLALLRAKRESQYLQPGRVKLVACGRSRTSMGTTALRRKQQQLPAERLPTRVAVERIGLGHAQKGQER